jgi:hypothetical protein
MLLKMSVATALDGGLDVMTAEILRNTEPTKTFAVLTSCMIEESHGLSVI